MKKAVLFVGAALGVTVALVAAFASLHKPAQRELTDLRIEPTPMRVERGRYLAHHVSGCMHCHTAHDDSQRSHPRTGPDGAGGACMGKELGLPGELCIPNLTPDAETGLGAWTDDEILRAIREGVSRDGRALFPMMPYGVYREMSDEDAYSIVAYLRSMEPVRNPRPRPTRIDFPVSILIELEPKPMTEPVPEPSRADQLAWGKYMATISGCRECHLEGKGGEELPTSAGVVRTANITTHETGVLPPTADAFVRLFRSYQGETLPDGVSESDYTVMGWRDYAHMDDFDLRAIHAYFLTVPPVENRVQTYAQAGN
jgi:hypothetical protein